VLPARSPAPPGRALYGAATVAWEHRVRVPQAPACVPGAPPAGRVAVTAAVATAAAGARAAAAVAAAGATVEAAAGMTVRVVVMAQAGVVRAGAAPGDPAAAEAAREVVDRVARGDPAATATAVGGRCSAGNARAASGAA
jgi:hypothetical protein